MNTYEIPKLSPACICFPVSLRETFLLRQFLGTCEAIYEGQSKISSLESINKSNLLNVPEKVGQTELKPRPARKELLSKDTFSGHPNGNGNGNQRCSLFSL